MKNHTSFSNMQSQRGLSLVVVLILLLIMTVLGLAVLRSTLLQERMSSNLYDRSLGFQSAEAALRDAEAVIRAAALVGGPVGYDCTVVGRVCPAVPANAYTGNVAGCAANDENCWANGSVTQTPSTGTPQYYVEFMGQRDSTDALGIGASANANQYGGGGGVPLEKLYRITARSVDPSTAAGRAVVVLQSNIAIK